MPEPPFQKETSFPPNVGNLDAYKNDYTVVEYLTNIASLLTTTADKYDDSQVQEMNDVQLSRYYDLKKGGARRHSSVISGSELSTPSSKDLSFNTIPNDNDNNNSLMTSTSTTTCTLNPSSNLVRAERVKYQMLVDHFINCAEHRIEAYQLSSRLTLPTHRNDYGVPSSNRDITTSSFNKTDAYSELYMGKDLARRFNDFSFGKSITDNKMNIDKEIQEQKSEDQEKPFPHDSKYEPFRPRKDSLCQSKDIIDMKFASPYVKYYKKLLTVDINKLDVLKRHNLWIPIIRDDCKDLLVGDYIKQDDVFSEKTCPLFSKGLDCIPTIYDAFLGCSVMKSIFSEFKFPALIYHSSITINKRIFMFGGLIPCYRYDAEAPNPNKYYVDGIKNLPPPLLPDIINNPTLVNNPHLYIYSIDSSRLSKPKLSGQIPPPLLCASVSKLTERHILFYGGFEIKTETKLNKDGKYYLKRSSLLNNTVYIFDTVGLYFTKVDIVAQSYQHVKYPTFTARFGHMQVSTSDIDDLGFSSNTSMPPPVNATIPGTPDSNSLNVNKSFRMPPHGMNRPTLNHVNHGVNVYTVIIFGGYRQTGDDKYEAMNDMWKLDIKVVGRGKRNFLKFDDTAKAVKIPIASSDESWPSKRAFFAYHIPTTRLINNELKLENLLKNLEENFKIDFKTTKRHDRPNSTNLSDSGKGSSNSPQPVHNRERKYSTSFGSEIHHSVSMQRDHESVSSSASSTKQKAANTATSDIKTSGLKPVGTNVSQTSESSRGRIIVIHGGSNNTNVFGDMWWFNLDNGTWKCMDTYGTRCDDPKNRINAQMKLVGHSMTTLGFMSIMVGGLSNGGVRKLYPNLLPLQENPCTEKDKLEEEMEQLNTRNSAINIIDLRTRCIQGCLETNDMQSQKLSSKSKVSSDTASAKETPHMKPIASKHSTPPEQSESRRVSSVGACVLESEGSVFVVGGLAARGESLNKMYLRGSLLEFVLPSNSLAS